ncbi:hypothetical protein BDR05DRAFT_946962 [Suillus weaverae]|nr:hypothetical protein BDR05DRAFT_946962 [Suillus weaverae]
MQGLTLNFWTILMVFSSVLFCAVVSFIKEYGCVIGIEVYNDFVGDSSAALGSFLSLLSSPSLLMIDFAFDPFLLMFIEGWTIHPYWSVDEIVEVQEFQWVFNVFSLPGLDQA